MCGICGVVGQVEDGIASRMLDAISHRGPDSSHVAKSADLTLGGCRLAILGSAARPLPWSDGGSLVVLNGEIYNYSELAKELGYGDLDPLDPESDLIQTLLAEEGWRGVSRLRGMFAIAAVEGTRALLVRDRLGIKPMFYSLLGDNLVFASEMKAILAHPSVSTELDQQALDEIAVFGYIVSPERTSFASIKQVSPGSVVELANGRVTSHMYWEPQSAHSEDMGDSLPLLARSLRGHLEAGLGEMLEHDPLPKGFYLSGGVDSSLLVMLAAQATGPGVLTFTLADREESPDLLAARAVASAAGTAHHEFQVTLDDYLRELPVFVRHYESVPAGGVFDLHGGIAFQMLSRRVAEHVRVAFSGEGADELFGGYYWPYTHPLGFSDGIRVRLEAMGSPDAVAQQVDALFPVPEAEEAYRLQIFDFLVRGGLANYHLWSVDRSSSAFGFEVRPAYLHDDVVEFALSLPVEAKVLNQETKRVLKEAARPLFDQYGLGHLVDREKAGMPAAVARIGAEVESLARELVSDSHLAQHPFARWVRSPLGSVMFDLFYHILVENRGVLPSGFDVLEFYRSGACADMYR
jgi:asparagine synthase (glutamine-hydrolysing)